MKVNLANCVIGAGTEFPAGEQEVAERFRPFFEDLRASEPHLVIALEPAPIPLSNVPDSSPEASMAQEDAPISVSSKE